MFVKSPAPDSAPAPSEPTPPPYEAAWEQSVARLQQRTVTYQEAEQRGHESTEAEAQNLAAAMRDVGDSQPDPKVRGDWHRRADRFARAGRTARRGILNEVGGIVRFVVLVPFMVVGTVLRIVGHTVRTTGSAVGGLGDYFIESSRAGIERIKSSTSDRRQRHS